MYKMKFSIGYNEEPDFLSLIKKYKDNISTVYFPMFYGVVGSGRSITERTNNIKEYYNKIIPLLILCKEYGIETDLLLNSACDGVHTGDVEYFKKIITLIKPLERYGISTITLTNLWHIEALRNAFPEIQICNSLNIDGVTTVEEALNLKNLGVDILTVDSSINYNIPLIKRIKEKTGLKIKIFLNDSCISNCPFGKQHANLASHFSEPNGRIWEKGACGKIYKRNRRKFFRVPFIRPEDLDNFNFADYFKLSTRDRSTEFIDNLLKIYINKHYDGNWLDILEVVFSDITDNVLEYIDNKKLGELGFFEDMIKCPKDCDNCTNCDKFF